MASTGLIPFRCPGGASEDATCLCVRQCVVGGLDDAYFRRDGIAQFPHLESALNRLKGVHGVNLPFALDLGGWRLIYEGTWGATNRHPPKKSKIAFCPFVPKGITPD